MLGPTESIILYLIAFVTSAVLYWRWDTEHSKRPRSKRAKLLAICALIPPVLIGIFRYRVGTDYETYERLFYAFTGGPSPDWLGADRIEPSLPALAHVSNFISSGPFLYFAIPVILSVCIYFYALEKFNIPNRWMAWAAYLVYIYPLNSLNLIRQGVAVSIIFLALHYALAQKPRKFMLLTAIACLFHYTSIVVLPLYFIARIALSKDARTIRRGVIVINTLVILGLGLLVIASLVLQSLPIAQIESGIISNYLNFSADRVTEPKLRIKLVLALALTLIPLYATLRHRYIEKLPSSHIYIAILASLYLSISVSSIYSTSIDRFANYLAPFAVLCIPLSYMIISNTVAKRTYAALSLVLVSLPLVAGIIMYNGSNERAAYAELNYRALWSKGEGDGQQ